MATGNDTDSDQSFNGFNSDDINDYHYKVNKLNDSVLEILSISSSDDDDGQSDIDISSVNSSDDNNNTQSESSIGEDGNDDGEQLVTYDPVWITDLENFQVPYFTSYMGSLLPHDFDCHTSCPIDYFRLFYTQYLADLLVTHTNAYHTWCVENRY